MEADIVISDDNQVTLKQNADCKQFTVPVTTFSAAGQDFIKACAAENVTYTLRSKIHRSGQASLRANSTVWRQNRRSRSTRLTFATSVVPALKK